MRSTQEIKAGDVLFRARHEARIASDNPIPKKLFERKKFQHLTINMLLPFGSELFANLTGRTFVGPMITPSELPEKDESED